MGICMWGCARAACIPNLTCATEKAAGAVWVMMGLFIERCRYWQIQSGKFCQQTTNEWVEEQEEQGEEKIYSQQNAVNEEGSEHHHVHPKNSDFIHSKWIRTLLLIKSLSLSLSLSLWRGTPWPVRDPRSAGTHAHMHTQAHTHTQTEETHAHAHAHAHMHTRRTHTHTSGGARRSVICKCKTRSMPS